MARFAATHICRECGAAHSKWSGRCETCGEWNSLSETATSSGRMTGSGRKRHVPAEFSGLDVSTPPPARVATGIAELDRVFGGGVVPASTVLIGGDPGIGKSTLMLQAAAALANSGTVTAYVSGEEARAQIQTRAERLGLSSSPLRLAAETNLDNILSGLEQERPGFAVIDSIQTMSCEAVDTASGSVAQLRACTQLLSDFARKSGCIIALVGHVTKDGQIAGPRVLEHMVDAVFYFEGERNHHFRILRSVKNRFGPTDEIGVFDMSENGLVGISDPSAMLLDSESADATGRAILATLEGSRPVLAEVQALIGAEAPGSARRSVVGWDASRLAALLAVLEAKCSIPLSRRDVYLAVAGGYKVTDPAGDLAAAAALLSSFHASPPPPETVFFGEIALSGTIRPSTRTGARLKEAARLGMDRAVVPKAGSYPGGSLKIHQISTLSDLVEVFSARERKCRKTA